MTPAVDRNTPETGPRRGLPGPATDILETAANCYHLPPAAWEHRLFACEMPYFLHLTAIRKAPDTAVGAGLRRFPAMNANDYA